MSDKLWRSQARQLSNDELKILIDHLEASAWSSEAERTQQRRRQRIYRDELERRLRKAQGED